MANKFSTPTFQIEKLIKRRKGSDQAVASEMKSWKKVGKKLEKRTCRFPKAAVSVQQRPKLSRHLNFNIENSNRTLYRFRPLSMCIVECVLQRKTGLLHATTPWSIRSQKRSNRFSTRESFYSSKT